MGIQLLKKTITYTDFDGKDVSEDHYFHLSKADLVEMEMSYKGGLHAHLEKIVASEDGGEIINEFKKLILQSYGRKSEDGRRFIKTKELREEFYSSEAYSELFMELCTNAEVAAEFVNGIVPGGLDEDLAKIPSRPENNDSPAKASRNRFEDNAGPDPDPHILTTTELIEMDSDELKSGLATGRYKLAP